MEKIEADTTEKPSRPSRAFRVADLLLRLLDLLATLADLLAQS
jgi:hypothetical protein